jgi:hypothetical protein
MTVRKSITRISVFGLGMTICVGMLSEWALLFRYEPLAIAADHGQLVFAVVDELAVERIAANYEEMPTYDGDQSESPWVTIFTDHERFKREHRHIATKRYVLWQHQVMGWEPPYTSGLRGVFRVSLWYPILLFSAGCIWATHGHLKRRKRLRYNLCIQCGYSLEGLTEPRCPECSAATTEPAR